MRAREILQEDYNQNLESDLNNILVSAKGSGATEVKTQDVVDQMYSMGYSVNVNSIISLLSNNTMIQNATPEMIVMTSTDGTGNSDDAQDSASQVADMAQSATKIG